MLHRGISRKMLSREKIQNFLAGQRNTKKIKKNKENGPHHIHQVLYNSLILTNVNRPKYYSKLMILRLAGKVKSNSTQRHT